MIFYDYHRAPNARRVRIFLAEKGITVDSVDISLDRQEQLDDDFLRLNDRATIPALLLDDGTLLTESVAICRFFEEQHPEPPLFGLDSMDRVMVEMWNRRAEIEGLFPAADAVRNDVPFFENRAITGPINFAQIPELADRGRRRLPLFYDMMEQRLAQTPFLAGPNFSVADITALCAMDFAKIVRIQPDESHPHVTEWRERVMSRPSAKA